MANKIKKWKDNGDKDFFKPNSKKSKKKCVLDDSLKTAVTLPLVVGGILVGTRLLKEI